MLKNLPKVSVVVLTYNGSEYLDNLLVSLSKQEYPDHLMEILVIDNLSTDDTYEKAKNYADKNIKVVQLGENFGYAAGNNAAFKYANHDHIVFLNQDTICHQGWLRGLVEGITGNENVAACASNMIMTQDGSQSSLAVADSPAMGFYDLSLFGYGRYVCREKKHTCFPKIISGCSFIITREAIEQLGYLFDEDLWMYVEDTDLSLRIYNMGYQVCVAANSIVFHLQGKRRPVAIGQLSTVKRAIQNRIYVFFKNLSSVEFVIYFPLLFLGSPFKIIDLHISFFLKIVLFIPFAIFSFLVIIFSLLKLNKFSQKKKSILSSRKIKHFQILRMLFGLPSS